MYRSRYRRITLFFARVILNIFICDLLLPRFGLRRWSRKTRQTRLAKIAIRYRTLAINMGGVLIKVGQFLSSRVDVLPDVITNELADLQDEVPPEDFNDIRQVAEKQLGGPISSSYISFDENPLAAASLGQVHRATIFENNCSGEIDHPSNVVVKIQRPNIEKIIATDMAALQTVGKWLKRYPPISRRADIPLLLSEFSRVLYEEIDYIQEGKNAETFANNVKDNPGVRVPRVIWSHTYKKVLTLEDVYAIKITDYKAITEAGIDRSAVAERLFNTYLEQIFKHNFFHADPHPGNLFVTPYPRKPENSNGVRSAKKEKQWQLTFVDFGMVGHISDEIRSGLREMVIGISAQNPGRLVKSYQMLGMLLPHANLDVIEKAEAKVFDRFWGKSMAELRQISIAEIHEFAKEFRGLIYSMPFQVPKDIIYLSRCVAILSGMCTGLNPDFNVWTSLGPFARELMAEEIKTGLDYWINELGTWVRMLVNLPNRMDVFLLKAQRGELSVQIPHLSEQINRLEDTNRIIARSIISAALLIGGIQLYLADQIPVGIGLSIISAIEIIRILLSKPKKS